MKYLQALQRARLENNLADGPPHGHKDAFTNVAAVEEAGIGGPSSSIRANTRQVPTADLDSDGLGSEYLASTGLFDGELARVPEVFVDPSLADDHAVAVSDPLSVHCEEYRNIRTHILRRRHLNDLQTLVIASVGIGEGKSITALNLAWLLAQTEGVKALLIDCDLRRPSLCGYLGIHSNGGLSSVLDGEAGLTDSLIRLRPSSLYLMPGGRSRTDVAELISGSLFPQVLAEARSLFDYVIIDAPPLGVFTDAAVLMNQADGALLVLAANKTSYKDVGRVLDSVPRERILGAVLNWSDESLIDSGYYDYPHYSARSAK